MGSSWSQVAEPAKECAACGKSKPLSEYHKNAKSPDGKRDRCPDCIIHKIPRKETRESKEQLGPGYMYVIMEREFIKSEENIYKIGMTDQYDPRKRLQNYPHDSRVILLIEKPDARRSENIVKDLLRAHREIKHRQDIGAEYFEGEKNIIVSVVFMS
jgi:hypothetical protein